MRPFTCSLYISSGNCALEKIFIYCLLILSRNTAKQTFGSNLCLVCGSRTQAMQEKVLNSLLIVIHKKRNVAVNSTKLRTPGLKYAAAISYVVQATTTERSSSKGCL